MTTAENKKISVKINFIDVDRKVPISSQKKIVANPGEVFNYNPPSEIGDYNIYLKSYPDNYEIPNDPFEVDFYYRLEDVVESQKNPFYLMATENSDVYEGPSKESKKVSILREKEVVESDIRLANKYREFWYRIGENRWVNYNYKNFSLLEYSDKKKIAAKNDEELKELKVKEENSRFNPNAKINFVKYSAVTSFDKPNGEAKNKLFHNEKVQIFNNFKDKNNVSWSNLGNDGWVIDNYISK